MKQLEPAAEAQLTFRWQDLPPVTAQLPGTGGVIRRHPEDFRVEELPLYLPEGSGSHAYARVRKRGLTTRDLVRALVARGVDERSIGVAGLKDKYAVTEQWLSVPQRHADALRALDELDGAELLEESRHRNKLGLGHLRGNRFTIIIRDVEAGALERAEAIVAALRQQGVPNYFGPQRFGRFGRNAVDGRKLTLGEQVPGGQRLQRFFLSALQSLLFNALLADRIEAGLYQRVVVGDWAKKHDTGGMFEVQSAAESERAERLEISATLPLYGRKVRVSAGVAGELETAVLQRFGLSWATFSRRHGDRRISRVLLEDAALRALPDALELTFTLPRGSYATIVLREVMKVPVDAPSASPNSASPKSASPNPHDVGVPEEADAE